MKIFGKDKELEKINKLLEELNKNPLLSEFSLAIQNAGLKNFGYKKDNELDFNINIRSFSLEVTKDTKIYVYELKLVNDSFLITTINKKNQCFFREKGTNSLKYYKKTKDEIRQIPVSETDFNTQFETVKKEITNIINSEISVIQNKINSIKKTYPEIYKKIEETILAIE